jgi:hypothetical protein
MNKQSVVDAAYFVSASSCNTIKDFWDYRMSPEQQAEFNNDIRLFSKTVKARYALMTGGSL